MTVEGGARTDKWLKDSYKYNQIKRNWTSAWRVWVCALVELDFHRGDIFNILTIQSIVLIRFKEQIYLIVQLYCECVRSTWNGYTEPVRVWVCTRSRSSP